MNFFTCTYTHIYILIQQHTIHTNTQVTNPLDVVKTRLQTDRVKPAPLSFFRNLRVVMQKEGLRRSFFRGLVPKIVSTAPLGILSSIMYEGVLFLSRKEGPKQVS